MANPAGKSSSSRRRIRSAGSRRTVEIDGYRFDLGGHRFFTKVTEVDDLWHEILGDEFLRRPACHASTGTSGISTTRCAAAT